MKRTIRVGIIAILLLISLLIMVTRTDKHDEAKLKMQSAGQDTPQQTLAKGMKALLDEDYETFDSCCYQGASASRAAYECYRKSRLVRDRLIAKFGKNAWDEFNRIEVDGNTTDLSKMYIDREVVVAAIESGLQFQIEGNLAYCILPWNKMRQGFRKAQNGSWYLDQGGETNDIAMIWTGSNHGLDVVMKNITNENITMFELKKEFEETQNQYYAEKYKGVGSR